MTEEPKTLQEINRALAMKAHENFAEALGKSPKTVYSKELVDPGDFEDKKDK
jgi:hypothetical protein